MKRTSPSPESFAQLLQRGRQGSTHSRGELLAMAYRLLLAHANHSSIALWCHKEDPDDWVQSTMVRALERFDQFRGSSLDEWIHWLKQILCSIICNRARYYTEQKRDVRREDRVAVNEVDDSSGAASIESEPIENLYKRELYLKATGVLPELSLDEKVLFFAAFWFEEPRDQILSRFHNREDYVEELYCGVRRKLSHRFGKFLRN